MLVRPASRELQAPESLLLFVPDILELLEDAPDVGGPGTTDGPPFVDLHELGRAVVGGGNELGHAGLNRVRDFRAGRPCHEVDWPVARQDNQNLGQEDDDQRDDPSFRIVSQGPEVGDADEPGVDPGGVERHEGANVRVEEPVALHMERDAPHEFISGHHTHRELTSLA